MDLSLWVELSYLFSSVLFVVGLNRLQSPATARGGNQLAALAMLIAIVATLVENQVLTWTGIVAGMVLGSLIGGVAARRVKMTDMPQLVGIFNGFGGGASALVAAAELVRVQTTGAALVLGDGFTIAVSCLIGTVTFSGSFIAFGKLQGILSERPLLLPGRHVLNGALALTCLGLAGWLIADPTSSVAFWSLAGVAAVLGIMLVVPIGGSDMPVVISLLNSYSGLAAAATGFVLDNNVLIIAGSLVGASGIFLTNEMCVAMNRSIWNVLFGGFGLEAPGTGAGAGAVAGDPRGQVKPYTIEDAVTVLENSQTVIFVPGYGMAASQAQHAVRELGEVLEEHGLQVRYAIHPVAGRMPGHMNVLLADANVSYDLLFDMEQINPDFSRNDVAIVIGANDVVNPAAHEDPDSPIYGMPVLDAEQSRTVMVLKRSMNPGFAGIDNVLFLRDNTMMLFGDAKTTLNRLIEGLKQ